ncbi:MAG: hypothetical protein AAGM67_07400, partial [Bacteroidota bacterium]
PNIEDDGYHRLQVTWDHTTQTLTGTFDNFYTVSTTFDPATVFNTTGTIYYGFTSSTLDFGPNPVNDHKVSFAGPGSAGSCSVVTSLPVELLDFVGEFKQDHVELNWLTAAEINNDFFEVQRSVDGLSWEALGNVKGAGTTADMNDYQYDDYLVSYGTNFYRLKQVDFDGSFSYSKLRAGQDFTGHRDQSQASRQTGFGGGRQGPAGVFYLYDQAQAGGGLGDL